MAVCAGCHCDHARAAERIDALRREAVLFVAVAERTEATRTEAEDRTNRRPHNGVPPRRRDADHALTGQRGHHLGRQLVLPAAVTKPAAAPATIAETEQLASRRAHEGMPPAGRHRGGPLARQRCNTFWCELHCLVAVAEAAALAVTAQREQQPSAGTVAPGTTLTT